MCLVCQTVQNCEKARKNLQLTNNNRVCVNHFKKGSLKFDSERFDKIMGHNLRVL